MTAQRRAVDSGVSLSLAALTYSSGMSTHQEQLGDLLASAQKTVINVREMFFALNADVSRFGSSEDQTERRAMVRAVFAYIEGACFSLRRAAIDLAKLFQVDLSPGEVQIANEVSYGLTEKGGVEERVLLTPTLPNVRFAMSLFAKSVNAEYEFPAGEVEFEKLRSAQLVRNRLTHPRTGSELLVSDDELKAVECAAEWFSGEVGKLYVVCTMRILSGIDGILDEDKRQAARTAEGNYKVAVLLQLMSDGFDATKRMSPDQARVLLEQLTSKRKDDAPGIHKILTGGRDQSGSLLSSRAWSAGPISVECRLLLMAIICHFACSP